MLTTFYSYGAVSNRRQGEIVRSLAHREQAEGPTSEDIAEAVALLSGRA